MAGVCPLELERVDRGPFLLRVGPEAVVPLFLQRKVDHAPIDLVVLLHGFIVDFQETLDQHQSAEPRFNVL